MKRALVSLVAAAALGTAVLAGCAPAAAPAPTAAPTKAAAPAVAAPAAPAATTALAAAAYPTKGRAIQMMVPFNAGGGTDVSARIFADALQKALGTPVEVLNKGGANGQVGTTEFVRNKPDGYSIMANNLPAMATYYLDSEKKAAFGRNAIQPIASTVLDAGVFVVNVDSPYKSIKELIDDAKAKPSTVKVSTTGMLSGPHLNAVQVERQSGAKFAMVHFDGASAGLTSLMGGHVDVQSGYVGDLLPSIKSGQTRALAVMDTKAHPFLPGVPTFESQGYKVAEATVRGFEAPAGTPMEIVKTLSAALKTASENPDVKKRMDDMGLATVYMDTDAFDKHWTSKEADFKVLIEDAKKQ